MNITAYLIRFLLLLFAIPGWGQGTFVYDQQSADENTGGGVFGVIQSNEPIGQSFTPSLSSVGFIRLNVGDTAINDLGATVYLNLRSDSVTGPILGTSNPLFMPDGFGTAFGAAGYTNFIFSTPVPVTPGTIYYFEPIVQSGDQWGIVAYSYGYPGGTAFFNGAANTAVDFWFREGVIVPEPGTRALLVLGLGALAWLRRKIL